MKNIFVTIKKSSLILICLCLTLLISHFVLYFKIESYKSVVDSLSHKIFNSFTDNYDTTEKDSNIFFVSNFGYKNLGNKLPLLSLPINEEFEKIDGKIVFKNLQNNVVKSAGEGIVKTVGFLDNGLKFVEVRHSGEITTRYENLKIVGVGTNFLVKNIHVLGTGNGEENIVFYVLKDNKILTNYEIENGEIKWQN